MMMMLMMMMMMMMMLNRKHRHECLVPRGGLWKPAKRDGVEKRWKGEGKGKAGKKPENERKDKRTKAENETRQYAECQHEWCRHCGKMWPRRVGRENPTNTKNS